jgi:hypothetical protein
MTAQEFAAWQERMGWSDAETARQLRCHRSQVKRYKQGVTIPGPVERLCELLTAAGPGTAPASRS